VANGEIRAFGFAYESRPENVTYFALALHKKIGDTLSVA